MEEPYKIAGNKAVFACKKCRVELRTPLDEAGLEQACPECGEKFITPGIAEKSQREAAAKRHESERLERSLRQQQLAARVAGDALRQEEESKCARRKNVMRQIEAAFTPLEIGAGACIVVGWAVIVFGLLAALLLAANSPTEILSAAVIASASVLYAIPIITLGWLIRMFAGIGAAAAQIAEAGERIAKKMEEGA